MILKSQRNASNRHLNDTRTDKRLNKYTKMHIIKRNKMKRDRKEKKTLSRDL